MERKFACSLAGLGLLAFGLAGCITNNNQLAPGLTVSSHEEYYRHYTVEGMELADTAEELAKSFKLQFDEASYPLAYQKAENGYERLQPQFDSWVDAVVSGDPERVAVAGETLSQAIADYGESLKNVGDIGADRGPWIPVVVGILQNQSTMATIQKVGSWWNERQDNLDQLRAEFRAKVGLKPWSSL